MNNLPKWTGWHLVPIIYAGLITEPRAAKKARPWKQRAVNYVVVLWVLWIPGALTFLRYFILALVESAVIVYALVATGVWATMRLAHRHDPAMP